MQLWSAPTGNMFKSLLFVALLVCSVLANPLANDNQTPEARLARKDLYQGDIAGHEPWTRNVVIDPDLKWSGGVVPYIIEGGHFSANDLAVIQEAFDSFTAQTCARFVPRSTEADYIHIFAESGCWSYVGRMGGSQDVSLQNPGCVYRGTIQHELMHALGIWHEQSRYDRDTYVAIQWGNIEAGREHNFDIHPASETTTFGLPYSYDSLMHYGAYDFSNGAGPTILTIPPGIPIGLRDQFSTVDISKINNLYC